MCAYPKFCWLPWLSVLKPQISVLLTHWRSPLFAGFHHMLESPKAPNPTEHHQTPCTGTGGDCLDPNLEQISLGQAVNQILGCLMTVQTHLKPRNPASSLGGRDICPSNNWQT